MRRLFHLPLSPFSRKVRLVLGEKRIETELVEELPWDRRIDFLRLNPAGEVPVFVDEDGQTIADSTAICEYLEETGDPATGQPIGSTENNLKAAVAGETHEYTDMYPGMAREARDEGFDEIADWFETLAKAERSHAGRFQKALNDLD